MHRREFVVGTLSVFASHKISGAAAQTVAPAAPESETIIIGSLPPLPADLAGNANEQPAPYIEIVPTGTARPSQEEIDRAYDLLLAAPYDGAAPIHVAQYFLAVGAGAYGEENRPFAREWPVRANPLIFHFFSATRTKPAGDTTAWCAAFVNWCILRAHAKTRDEIGKSPGFFSKSGKPFSDENLTRYSTNDASSGSFRCWGPVSQPSQGHLVVFKDPGTDSLTPVCKGQGHVAFFLGVPRDGRVRVLGGNQSAPGSSGAITVADMATTPGSRFMKYVGLKQV